MKRLTRLRYMFFAGAAILMSGLLGAYHFGGVTLAALAALAVPVALPFLLGKFGNDAVRTQAGQPDQLKHRELTALVDAVNEVLVAARRSEDELGIQLNASEKADRILEPLSSWVTHREGTVDLFMLRGKRLDPLRLDEIAKARKALRRLEEEEVQDLERKFRVEQKEVEEGLKRLGYERPEPDAKGGSKDSAEPKSLSASINDKIGQRTWLINELESAADDIEHAYEEVVREFPSASKYEHQLTEIRARLVALDASTAIRLIKEVTDGISERPRQRFDSDRIRLMSAIETIEETNVSEFLDPRVREDWKAYTRFALAQKNPLRYRRLLEHTKKFPERISDFLSSLETSCMEIDRITHKDYIIDYKERFPPLDGEFMVSDVEAFAQDAARRIVHLQSILESHEDDRRISENYQRVEKRIRRLLEHSGSVGPDDLKVRTPERYLMMFADREAAVILEGGRLRLATEQDERSDPAPETSDDGRTAMEQEG